MNEKVMQVRIGITMITALVLFAFLLLLFNNRVSVFARTKTVTIQFENAPGVALDTPVRKLGIRIGFVTGVEFSEDGRSVLVSARLDAAKPVLTTDRCRINSGLLGDAVIEFVPVNNPAERRDVIPDKSVFKGEVKRDPLQVLEQFTDPAGELAQTMSSIKDTSNKIGALAQSVDELLGENPEDLQKLVNEVVGAVENISNAAASVDGLLNDQEIRAGLRATTQRLPETLGEFTLTLGKIGAAALEAQRALADIRTITETISKSSPELAKRFDRLLDQVDLLFEEVNGIVAAANSKQSPIRQFLDDPNAYPEIKRSIANLSTITRDVTVITGDFRKELDVWFPQIRYILENVGEITGKISQHPGSPIRDAVRPSRGLTVAPNGTYR